MITRILHDLDELPRSAVACLLGEHGRNRRFHKVLQSLRPDVTVASFIHMGSANCGEALNALRDRGEEKGARPCEVLLVTSTKLGRLTPLLSRPDGLCCYMVNPNFYHPFMQWDGVSDDLAAKLAEARGLFPEEQDRTIYDLVLSAIRPKASLFDIYRRLAALHARMGHQYLDYINPGPIRTVIEGGLADGADTIRFLARFSQPSIFGFEPDQELYQTSYFRPYLESHPQVRVLPLGLWSGSETLSFQTKQPGRSVVAEEAGREGNGDFVIRTVSIDEFVRAEGLRKVDFIKMDIEGSELNALQGARETIRSHRPQMAICIYHRLEHYHEIPLLLARWVPDYIFRIGHYSPLHVFSETVFYGIPKELAAAGTG